MVREIRNGSLSSVSFLTFGLCVFLFFSTRKLRLLRYYQPIGRTDCIVAGAPNERQQERLRTQVSFVDDGTQESTRESWAQSCRTGQQPTTTKTSSIYREFLNLYETKKAKTRFSPLILSSMYKGEGSNCPGLSIPHQTEMFPLYPESMQFELVMMQRTLSASSSDLLGGFRDQPSRFSSRPTLKEKPGVTLFPKHILVGVCLSDIEDLKEKEKQKKSSLTVSYILNSTARRRNV